MTATDPSQSSGDYESIKLGIDAHDRCYWVSSQVDGATPQPVQKMTDEELLLFVVKQQTLTRKVVTFYEAGAFGFHLHRRFEELGIKNFSAPHDDTARAPGMGWKAKAYYVKRWRVDILVGRFKLSALRSI
jgi:hypothetical protein